MNRLGRCVLLSLCIVTLLLAPMYAQKTTGTIRGVVTDPSGAVVSNIPVVISSATTGTARTVNTNAQGEYIAAELPAGVYSISVKAPNFKEVVANSVEVHVSSTETQNLQLQVGSTSEQVTVNASEIQVQTDNAALGEVVTGEQVRELPLNGRSFVQLTQLQPGVAAANNFSANNKGLLAGVDFSVNGNSTTNNLFLVDGANNNDVGSNRTILIYPSIEAISEFKMLRNSYGPEYGQASGAVINIVTRSGSNQWHGDLLYFGRNDALNAYEYFAANAEAQAVANGQQLPHNGKNVLQRNDYGFSLGGPIKKDKLFFFYSQEWNKEKRGVTRSACVPSAAEQAGDFTNPSCGAPQPTGLVAAGLANPATPYKLNTIDPGGSLLAQELPLPNLSTPTSQGYNWVLSPTSPIDWRQENARIDYNISHTETLMFRYTQDDWSNNYPNLLGAGGLWGDDPWPALESNWAQPSKQIVGRLTSTIGTSMVNDLEFAYSDNRINITPGGTTPGLLAATTAGVPSVWPSQFKDSKVGIPTLWGGFQQYGNYNNLWLIAPWNNSLDIYTVRDDFSKVWGAHTIRFGGFMGWNGKNEMNGATSTEYKTFSPADWGLAGGQIATGNALANALVPGNQFAITEPSTNLFVHIRWRDYEAYVADNWKIRRNLTLDYGLRYSILAPPFQPNNQFTSFRPNLYNPALGPTDACNGLVTVPGYAPCTAVNNLFGTNFTEAAAGQNRSLKDVNYHLFAPRLGVSWDPFGNGNTAIRAGFGIFYQRDRTTPAYVNSQNAPFVLGASVNRTIDQASAIPTGSASPSGGYDPSNIVGNSLQWNLTWEQAIKRNTTIEIGYVGNHAEHQLNNYDVNYVPQNATCTGACAVAAPQYAGLPAWEVGSFVSGTALTNYLRSYPGWGTMSWWLNNGDATYNALQVLFKTQIQKLQLQAAYTYSHSIGDIDNQNSSGGTGWESSTYGPIPSLDRGNTGVNRPQIFVANAVYYLPDLKGQSEILQAVAGGWELAGITQYATGASTSLYANTPSENTANLVAGASSTFSTLVGTGFNNNLRPLIGTQGCTAGNNGAQVLNPNAVTLVGYQIGTLPTGMEPRGYCLGPGNVNTDFSIDKNWRLWGERMRLQFRLDFFNLFNHANFRGDQVNGVAGGNVFAGINCGAANGAGKYQPCSPSNNIITSDTYTSTAGQATLTRGAREIQYGLKLIF